MSDREGIAAVTSASSLAKSNGAFLPTYSVLVIGQSLLIIKWKRYYQCPMATVSLEQRRQGSTRSTRYFDSTTAEACATIKQRTGARGLIFGSPSLVVNT